MRTHGEIDGVSFQRIGFSIYSLGTEYRLRHNGQNKVVSVNNMTELKNEISEVIGEYSSEEDQIQVRPLHSDG